MTEPLAIATGLVPGQVIGEARTSDEMLEIWRLAKAKIGLSNKDFDELANLGDGHVDKLLGPTCAKNFGPKAFSAVNWTMALKWICVVDADQLAVVEPHWQDRQRQLSHVRPAPARVSKLALERARPVVMKEFSEKLSAALVTVFGPDMAHLLGVQPEPGIPATTGDSAKADDDKDTVGIADGQGGPQETIIKSEPATVRTPAPGRAHLRVIQFKNGRKFG